jgi:hypothetical protein
MHNAIMCVYNVRLFLKISSPNFKTHDNLALPPVYPAFLVINLPESVEA